MNNPEANPHCSTPPELLTPLPASMPVNRQRAIIVGNSKWVNGTVLHYAFFGEEPNPAWAAANEAQKEVVRESFQQWQELPIGLVFEEVAETSEAEVRISFDQSDGSWSYIGRGLLKIGQGEPTMNFGWPLDSAHGRATALHEIGHAIGMPHEHQSPFSGIVWDEEAVYTYFTGPPNNWPRETVEHNVLNKLNPSQVEGSTWDPTSIMEYEFGPGLIVEPAEYREGIVPPGKLSERDIQWMQSWYPAQQPAAKELSPLQSAPLPGGPQAQGDFTLKPPASRSYQLSTFGAADTVMVLFERVDGELRYLAGDDDSGEERNARLEAKLFAEREYVLRVRVNWADQPGQAAVMYT